MWIREAKCDKPFMRNTRVIMKAPLYEPYTPQKCRKRKKLASVLMYTIFKGPL